jgi:hypothetical protein
MENLFDDRTADGPSRSLERQQQDSPEDRHEKYHAQIMIPTA